ncbi:MAG: hypothetical protein M3P51_05100, partial [Chloroflexota bacterium]|nr:hypothetical protein [Chloroflexota bacterium]
HGLEHSITQLEALPQPERDDLKAAILDLVSSSPPYLMLEQGKLVVAHAGIKGQMIGKVSERIKDFTLYGDVTGAKTPDGMPERRDWAAKYQGGALIVYGHTPVRQPILRYRTVNIDQGCVFGGRLTALRYPEMEFVQVRARETYYQHPSGNPFRHYTTWV